MKRVVCINDRKQPEGAEIVEGKEYEVVDEFVNNFDQRVFIISGIKNKGVTSLGLQWYGYDASRFTDMDALHTESYEFAYALN